MSNALTIGNFSRATHLTVKTLRHYHEVGLLEPAEIDPHTGYRRYSVKQIPTAQIIRRFRALDMPLETIQAVLAAKDVPQRNDLIAAHLKHLEKELAHAQDAVAALRSLLDRPVSEPEIGHRRVESVMAAAICETIEAKDAAGWLRGALGELAATMAAQGRVASRSAGGIYANALFARGRGEAILFIPCEEAIRPVGRVASYHVPTVELATLVHEGSHANIDLAYGALAAHVTRRALAVEGPLREYYLVGPIETSDQTAWRTEIGWPIFQTV